MLTPGSHGGDIYSAAKQLYCKPSEIIDFSSNINSIAPAIELPQSRQLIRSYGDPKYCQLHGAVASRYGLKRDQIALFNGASSAIFELFRYLKPKQSYLYAPLYGEYTRSAREFSQKTTLIDRRKSLYKEPKKGSTVVFVNPSTPDGKYYDLERLFTIWKRQKCHVIIDESFLEFGSNPSVRHKIKSCKRLYIIQSFTKFYACAGLRVGAVFSHSDNIVRFTWPMWNISSYDAAYVTALLQDPDHPRRSCAAYKKQYRKLRTILKESSLFDKVYKSDANFILVRSSRSPDIYKELFKQKILVRDCSNFDGFDQHYLRFAVKDNSALKMLKKVLHALA